MAQRRCPCGELATNRKGPARCPSCRAERVRLAQQRYRDKDRGSSQRGMDEPKCLWCGTDNAPRPFETLRPKRFCSDQCRARYRNEMRSVRVHLERVCSCGNAPANRTGVPVCAECRAKHKRNLGRARTLKPYGLSEAEYLKMLSAQGGRCAICRRMPEGSRGRSVLVVDHDHDTGEVRGLLCHACNTAIGMFQDDPKLLVMALRYLGAQIQGPIAWWAKSERFPA